MFRRIATVVDIADVLGAAGIVILLAVAWSFDPRIAIAVVGLGLIVAALIAARPGPPAAPPAA
jgi:hypothetical protein